MHLADSKEELDSDTETLQSIARKHLCQLAKLSFQQQDGLITALPLGLRRIDALRTLTTEALAVLMPFKAQEIRHRHGIYYGQNAISKNLILADRKELLNGNGFILGVSGSGKSFAAKREITEIALSTNDDIIIITPKRNTARWSKAWAARSLRSPRPRPIISMLLIWSPATTTATTPSC